MFNLGFGEILVICILLIIVVGPERLPTLMKNVGKGMRTVREASREIRATIGIDELMREDVFEPPRFKVQPPPATISRDPVAAPDTTAPDNTAGDAPVVGSAATDANAVPTPVADDAPKAPAAGEGEKGAG